MPAPLAGVRVLDVSRVLAGPFCGQLLGDLGADVIKLERPGSPDETRGWGPPFVGPFSAYFLSCNRNKRAVTLDLASPDGRPLFDDLLSKCDVLLENFRSDSAVRLGLTPDRLLARHPRLIVCSISGFGRTGPLAETPGYDFAIQALSGLMSITGPVDGPPSKVGIAVADILTGLYAATAVLACLRGREQTGHGYAVDLSLFDCAVASQMNLAQAYLSSGGVPARQGNAHLQIVPYQLFATADGWLVLAVGNDGQWRHFCAAVGRSELAEGGFALNADRVRLRAELVPIVEAILRGRTTADWQRLLTAANVSHAVVQDYSGVFASAQAEARGLKVSVTGPDGQAVDLLGSPFHLHGAELPTTRFPPTPGQDTDAVLGELLGLDAERLAELRRLGVV